MLLHTTAHGSEQQTECSSVKGRVYYTAKSGDYLFLILQRFNFVGPIWDPKRKYIIKTSRLNQIQNPDLILVGDTIDLPFACEHDLLKFHVTPTHLGREVHIKTERSVAGEESGKPPITSQKDRPAEAAETRSFKTFSRLRVGSTYEFFRIDSASSTSSSSAILLSEPSHGLNLDWEQIWSEQFSTQFQVSQTTVQMRDASSGILEGGRKDLGQVGFSVNYSISPKLIAKFDSSYGNELFVRAITAGQARLDSVDVSRFGASLVSTLIQKDDLGFDLKLGYFQLMSTETADYSLRSGWGYILAPSLRHKLDHMQMELQLKYEQAEQDSNISSQQRKQVGIYFGLSFEVGK